MLQNVGGNCCLLRSIFNAKKRSYCTSEIRFESLYLKAYATKLKHRSKYERHFHPWRGKLKAVFLMGCARRPPIIIKKKKKKQKSGLNGTFARLEAQSLYDTMSFLWKGW